MHPNRKDEIALFKSHINLTEYAAAQGYTIHRRYSSRNSVAMRGPVGDKIIVARDARDGNWIYFSVTDDQDHGTIIDFLDHRGAGSLGDIRKILRPWVGLSAQPLSRPPATTYQHTVEPIERDRAATLAQFAACTPLTTGHAYLEHVRHIPMATLDDPRFAGRLYTDAYANAIFPHYDHAGICGFEIRNVRFRGFSKSGKKGLWYSTTTPDDTSLVITESAIDALSYHALHHPVHTRYFSIAGEMAPVQHHLLASGLSKLPPGSTVILAMDHDAGGAKLATTLRSIVEGASRTDLGVMLHQPEQPGDDWNAVLTAQTAPHHPVLDTPHTRAAHRPRIDRVLKPRRPARFKP